MRCEIVSRLEVVTVRLENDGPISGTAPKMPRQYEAGWFVPDQLEIRYLHDAGAWRVWEWVASGWAVPLPSERTGMRRCRAGHLAKVAEDMPGWVAELVERCRPGDEPAGR
jgi:hypothetical protein